MVMLCICDAGQALTKVVERIPRTLTCCDVVAKDLRSVVFWCVHLVKLVVMSMTNVHGLSFAELFFGIDRFCYLVLSLVCCRLSSSGL